MDTAGNNILRMGESGTLPIRSERYFQQEGYWYFRTREGLDIGPCDSKDCAISGVNGFIGYLKEAEQGAVTSISKYVKMQPRGQEILSDIPARTDRIFQQENYWYYRIREGMDIGPFDSRGEASLGVRDFVSFFEESQPEIVEKVAHYLRSA